MAATNLSVGSESELALGTPAATVVVRFGGAAVSCAESIRSLARQLVAARLAGERVVAVVSAAPATREKLVRLALEVTPRPTPREYDLLLSAGERIAAALCAMAVCDEGGDAVSFTGAQAGIVTDAAHGGAGILGVRPQRLVRALAGGKIVLVAGGQGVSMAREVTTLGPGGSDVTAVALASALDARCEIVLDEGRIYSADPSLVPDALELSRISYEELLELTGSGGAGIARDALDLAQDRHQAIVVRPPHGSAGTWVGPRSDPLLYGAEVAGVAVEASNPDGPRSDVEVGRVSLVGSGVRTSRGAESAMVDALSLAGITARRVTRGDSRITCVVAASELRAAAVAVHERFRSLIADRVAPGPPAVQVAV